MGPFSVLRAPICFEPLNRRLAFTHITALAALALLLLPPGPAAATDLYEASWNGGHLTAIANAGFTEATIESVSVSFDGCGTQPEELTCTWEAKAILLSHPASRCNPATPEEQIAWTSGEQSGNGAVADGSKSFPLEGCRGQTVVFELAFHKTYEEGGSSLWRSTGGASIWGLFTFGYHPAEEAEREIVNENPPSPAPPPFVPNFTPSKTFALSPDCATLRLNSADYVFVFQRMGCHKAGNLARLRYFSGRAPKGFACRRLPSEGIRCWRRHEPAKFFEWHPPRLRS